MAYTPHTLKVGSIYIPISQATPSPQVEAIVQGAGGSVDPTVSAVGGTMPIMTFNTPALGTALGACSFAPTQITSGTTVVVYFAQMGEGTYVSGANHKSITINEATLFLSRVSGERGKPAVAEYKLLATYDGTNAPFVVGESVSLPSADLLSELYSVCCAVISYGESSSVQVKLNSASLDCGVGEMQERSGATIHPTISAVMKQEPVITLDTMDIATMLAVAGIDPLVSTGTVIYFAKYNGPSYASGSVHIGITANDPLVVLKTMSGKQDETATMSYEGHAIYSDSTAPITISTTTALPTLSALGAAFTLGPVSFNSTEHEVQEWTLDTGLTVTKKSHKGIAYPQIAAVTKREPVLTGTVLNVGDVPMFGSAESNAELWLRKVAEGGTRVSETTAEHIQLLLTASLAFSDDVSGDWGNENTQGFTMRPTKSGANAIITIDTAAAITEA